MRDGADEFWRRKRPDGSRGAVYWTNLFGRRRSTGCTTLRLARAWKDTKLLDAANPRLAAAQKATLAAAIADLIAELRRRGRSPATIRKNEQKLGHFPRLWGKDCKLASVDAKLVASYIDARLEDDGAAADTKLSRTTIRDELAALRQMLKLARRHGMYSYAIEDVLPDRFETGHVPRKDYVPFHKLHLLFGQLPRHRRAHVLFYCVTGGRTADSFRALRKDFDAAAWSILVRGSKTPKSWRTIPVPEFLRWLVVILLATAPGDEPLFLPWSEGSMNRDIKAACTRAGLAPVSTNGLRRTFGHALRMAGYSLDVISKLFGHTTEKLARDVYADFDAAELAAIVALQGAAHKNGTASPETGRNLR